MEIDTDQLEAVLHQLSQDLSQPFLERRGRDHLHKQSLVPPSQVEELRDVVTLLNQRERELAAAVGIAQMLLSKGKNAVLSLEEVKEQGENMSRTIRSQQQEIQLLREALLTAEERYSKTSALLVEAENNIEKLSGEAQHYQEHLRTLQRKSLETAGETAGDRELSEKMKEQAKAFERNPYSGTQWMWERENAKLRESNAHLSSEIQSLKDELASLKTASSLSHSKTQDFNRVKRTMEEKIKGLEEALSYKELDLSVARRKVERLTEELGNGSPWPEETEKVVKPRASFLGLPSLESDSDSCEEALVTLSPRGKSGCKHFVFDSFQGLLSLDKVHSIEVKGSDQVSNHKDPGKEYFALASQAVKMNSPYMDTICTVSTKELYAKAVRNSIPFHKVRLMQWHIWIESQLTSAYLESLYTAENRKNRGRKTGK